MFTLPKDSKVNGKDVKKAIESQVEYCKAYEKLEAYYEGRHDILTRTKPSKRLSNNQVVINHAEYITDVNVGYLLGQPVKYKPDETVPANAIQPIEDAYKRQTISDLDHELGTDSSIYGHSYEICYVDETSNVNSAKLEVEGTVMVYDDTVKHSELYAITYGKKVNDGYENVVVYDAVNIYTFSEDLKTITTTVPHRLAQVPVVKYRNNARETGDFFSVLRLIDAYNKIQSDRVNDKEQLVEAILMLYGFTLTKQQKQDLQDFRMMSVPPRLQGTGAEYLVKNLNEADIDVLREKIEADIHKISKTPNLSDENFVGNASGVAIKYKLIVFEQNTKNKERYFERGLKKRFKIYNDFYALKAGATKVNPENIDVIFSRSLPQNDLETSQMLANVGDLIDRKTAISELSFIDNPDAVLKAKDKEKADALKAQTDAFGTNNPSTTPLNDTNKPITA